jgi:tetratricopeptide (TPR) repeat protein
MRRFFPLALAAAFCACDSYRFYSGRFLHETKRWASAVKALEKFVEKSPTHPRACEARLRLGSIYAGVFERHLEARRHYEAAARSFPDDAACVEKAKAGVLSAPDYFPVEPGRTWVFGDSASGGRAMRLEWQARDGGILASLFAGNKRLSVNKFTYEKRGWTVSEVGGKTPAVFLRYPFTKGSDWKAHGLNYRIEADSIAVEVRAGAFNDCIKVRESNPAMKAAWKYDYYCPGVGRVKTTVGTPGVESPNTELIRYSR